MSSSFHHQTLENLLHIDSMNPVNLYFTSDSPQDDSTTPFSSSSSTSLSPIPRLPTSYKLTVRNLSYTTQQRSAIKTTLFRSSTKKPASVNILKNVSFVANTSEILAVVGPSGAGKSSLLRIVAGRIGSAGKLHMQSLSLNNHPLNSLKQLRKICGFVAQEDNLLPLLTVKETLMFSARFRLRGTSMKDKEERVDSLIKELGLGHVTNTFIGDEEHRGISGGERKRVSIGVDVIHDPPILLLDEPTSGLDSGSALQVMEMLSSMAQTRSRTIILTIHQPSYRVLQYISSILLISRGSVSHSGSLESLEKRITQLDFKIPSQLNPLEFAMEIIKTLEDSYPKNSEEPRRPLPCTWLDEGEDYSDDQVNTGRRSCSRFDEIMSLTCRFWKIIYRTKQLFLARTMQAIVAGFGLGSVYLNVKKDQSGVAERLGLFAFSLSFLLSSTVEALPIFLHERRVLMREVSRGAYRVSSYMIANTMIFVPFLLVVAILFSVPVYWIVGLNPSLTTFLFFIFLVWLIVLMASSLVLFLSAVSPDFISGNSLIGTVLGGFFLFSGYFISKESIPKYWLFMYYLSLYKYPLDSFLLNEYWSMRDDCFSWDVQDGSKCLITGLDVLRMRGIHNDNRWMNVGIMFGFFLFYRVLCFIILSRRASKTNL